MITNKDVEKLKETFAAKEDLKQFATKEDLKQFATKEDLKQFATKKEMNKRFNTVSEDIKNFKEEIIRHFDVVAEDIISSNKLVSEQVSANTEKLAIHEEKFKEFESIKTRMIAMEVKIGK